MASLLVLKARQIFVYMGSPTASACVLLGLENLSAVYGRYAVKRGTWNGMEQWNRIWNGIWNGLSSQNAATNDL